MSVLRRRRPSILRFSRADWLCLLGWWGLSSAVCFVVLFWLLQVLLSPGLMDALSDKIERSVLLTEALLEQERPGRLPAGVRTEMAATATGPVDSKRLDSGFDRALQRHLKTSHGLDRVLRKESRPLGGYWVKLELDGTAARAPVWLWVHSSFTSLELFWPLVRSLTLIGGALGGLVLFLHQRLERPLNRLLMALPDSVNGDDAIPQVPERGAEPLQVLARRINQLIEQRNSQAAAKRDLLRGLVHDLRSPLTRLLLRSHQLQRRLQPEAVLEALPLFDNDLTVLQGIADQLSALASNVDPGQEERSFALDGLCARIAQSYPGGVVELKLPRLLVRLNQELLLRSLTNLIDNALDYGQPPVLLSARRQGRSGLQILVEDQGTGPVNLEALSSGVLPRADDRQRSHHRGLGLAIVRRFCSNYGGELQLSRSGRGGLRVAMLLPPSVLLDPDTPGS